MLDESGLLEEPSPIAIAKRLGYSEFGMGLMPELVERPPDGETGDGGPTRPRPLARGWREVALDA